MIQIIWIILFNLSLIKLHVFPFMILSAGNSCIHKYLMFGNLTLLLFSSNKKIYLNQCTMQRENCKNPVKNMPLQFCVGNDVDKL